NARWESSSRSLKTSHKVSCRKSTQICSDGRKSRRPWLRTTTHFHQKNKSRPQFSPTITGMAALSISSDRVTDFQKQSETIRVIGSGGRGNIPGKASSFLVMATSGTCRPSAPAIRSSATRNIRYLDQMNGCLSITAADSNGTCKKSGRRRSISIEGILSQNDKSHLDLRCPQGEQRHLRRSVDTHWNPNRSQP